MTVVISVTPQSNGNSSEHDVEASVASKQFHDKVSNLAYDFFYGRSAAVGCNLFNNEVMLSGKNRYEFQEQIGAGAYSTVYRAIDNATGDLVAVKKGSNLTEDEVLAMCDEMIVQEALAKKVNSVLPVRDVFIDEGKLKKDICFVMDYSSISNLYQMYICNSDSRSDMSPCDILQLGYKLLAVEGKFIREKLLHCDMKPENILYDKKTGKLVVLDLGCYKNIINGKVINPRNPLTTRPYRSPGLYLLCDVDERNDMWGIGCVLYELYTKSYLFPAYENDESQSEEQRMMSLIVATLGTLPPHAWMSSKKGKEFFENVIVNGKGQYVLKRNYHENIHVKSIRQQMEEAAVKRHGCDNYVLTNDEKLLIEIVEVLLSYTPPSLKTVLAKMQKTDELRAESRS
jgi:serine/threonine protein kinase